MKYLKTPVGVIVYGFLFACLFYHKGPGINLVIFELPLLAFLTLRNRALYRKKPAGMVYAGTLLSLLAFAWHGSAFTLVIHALSVITLSGMAIYPQARTVVLPFMCGMAHTALTPFYLVQRYRETRMRKAANALVRTSFNYAVVPLLLVLVFSALYSFANPIFSNGVSVSLNWISDSFRAVFPTIDVEFTLLVLLGCCLTGVFIFTGIGLKLGSRFDLSHRDDIDPAGNQTLADNQKTQKDFRVFMVILIVLNILIALMNLSDIRFVWIGFEWTGEHLKMFVHEGTYALILSILISMAMVVYFFRRNMNFYQKGKYLRYLANAWLIQNGILSVSVLIRNYHYIHNFSLAYRRIGVVFFIIVVIFGLYTVWVKINKRKSIYYLFRMNSSAVYITILLIALVPWDSVIARYNLSSSNQGFVHLEFLATLSDKTLNTLNAEPQRVHAIVASQNSRFNDEAYYIGADEFLSIVERRTEIFDKRMRHSHWLSYNLAEYLAWKKLQKQAELTL